MRKSRSTRLPSAHFSLMCFVWALKAHFTGSFPNLNITISLKIQINWDHAQKQIYQIAVSAFLVDVFCLGVKSSFYGIVSESEYYNKFKDSDKLGPCAKADP